MPIIPCRFCGKQISDQAKTCPFCNDISFRDRFNKLYGPAFLAIVFIVGITVTLVSEKNKAEISATNERIRIEKKQKAKEIRKQQRAAQRRQREVEEQAKLAAMSPEELRKKEIEKEFSAWDGSHRGLTRAIKKVMNDPSSYDHVETSYSDRGDHLIVKTIFRGSNAFGAIVRNTIKAKVSNDGQVLAILERK